MASILFSMRNKGTDESLGHRRGDPIAERPDGHAWGHMEDKRAWVKQHGSTAGWHGNSVVLEIRGLSVRRARKLREPHTRPASAIEPEFGAPDLADRIVQVRRKRWGLFFEELPLAVRQKLADVGFASVSLSEIAPFLRNKFDGTRVRANARRD